MELESLSLFIGIVTVFFWIYSKYKNNSNRLPGPFNLPIVGYLPWLDRKAPYLTLTELSQKFGRIYGLYLGNIYTVVISDAKLLNKVFSKEKASGRAPLYLTHGIMKGYGLICAEGELCKNQRKIVHDFLKSLGRKKIENTISKNVSDLVQFIQNSGDEAVFNPAKLIRHNVGSVINEIVFGKPWPKDDETWMYLQRLQEEGSAHLAVGGPVNFLPFLRFLPMFKKPLTFLEEAVKGMHNIFNKLIEKEEKSYHDGQIPSNLIQAYIAEKKKSQDKDIGKYFTDLQFYHVLIDVFGAGLDTTLNSLTYVLLYTALYQNVQIKMREEIDRILQGNPPTLEDLPLLPYVKATLSEVQRIHTNSPLGVPHAALDDFEAGGYKIKKGTMIIGLLWGIHMDQENWNEPEIFKPERFLNKEGEFYTPSSFIPFSVGKRMCLGEEMGKMLLFLFSVALVQNFQIDFKNPKQTDLQGDCGLTISPKPHLLIFRKLAKT